MTSGSRPLSAMHAFGVAAALTVIVFWNSTGLTRVFDDWSYHAMARDALDSGSWRALLGTSIQLHWSPLSWLIEVGNAWLVDAQDDRAIRALNALFLFTNLLTFAWVARRARLGAVAMLAGMGILAFHHANAVPLFSYDVYTQVGADTFVWLSLACALAAATSDDPRRARRAVWASYALFVVALLLKEQGLATVPGLALLAAWFTWREPRPRSSGALWRLFGGVAITAGAFMVVHTAMGAAFSASGPYALCLSCAPANTAILLAGVFDPFPTIHAFLGLRNEGILSVPVLMAVVGATGVGAALRLGRRSWRDEAGWSARTPLLLGLMAASAPAVMLTSVRSFHGHSMLFWFALLMATAIEGWGRVLTAPRPRAVGAAVLALYLGVLYAGQCENLAEIRATSDRARTWLVEINRALDTIPPDATAVLDGFGRLRGENDYSLIRMTTPAVLLDRGAAITVTRRGRGPTIYLRDDWADLPDSQARQAYVVWVLQTGVIVQPPGADRGLP